MKPYIANFLNAIVLIALGCWAFFTSKTPSVTALIPVFVGVILIIITPSFRRGNRVLAHIAVILTFLILIALIKPLTGAIGRADNLGFTRVIIMMATSFMALIVFIKSFIDARRTSNNQTKKS